MRWLGVLCGLAVLAAGCEGEHRAAIARRSPPSPATWPAYPNFSEHSCWARPLSGIRVIRSAPSFAFGRHRKATPPSEIVRRLLARFGDRTYVRGIEIGAPPPRSKLKGFFPGPQPPGDALWAYIEAPYAEITPVVRPTSEIAARIRAEWETELIGGALLDDFCRAGGRSLEGWSIGGQVRGVSDGTFALGQRFPNPSQEAFRKRVDAVGKRYGFRLASLRLVRPRQLAPILIVETSRDRKAFVRDVPEIVSLLDPTASGRWQTAITFEGFFFEARDDKRAFYRFRNVYRGAISGGDWSWDRCVHAYPSLAGDAACPQD